MHQPPSEADSTPYRDLVKRIRAHFDGISAAVEGGLSNSRLEGIKRQIHLISRRAHGDHNTLSLTAMIYLCLGGITIPQLQNLEEGYLCSLRGCRDETKQGEGFR